MISASVASRLSPNSSYGFCSSSVDMLVEMAKVKVSSATSVLPDTYRMIEIHVGEKAP